MSNTVAILEPKSMTLKQIDDMIVNIKSRGKKLDADIQICGLAILKHVNEHGDITKANALYNALPKGSRRTALAAWFVEFGALKYSEKKDKKENPLAYNKKQLTNLQGAMNKPWWECKGTNEDGGRPFDLESQLKSLLTRMEKAREDGKEVKTGNVNVDELKKLIAQVK